MRENDLLAYIQSFNAELPGGVILPPGDDMAGLKIGGAVVLAASDQILEGVHFDAAAEPHKIGRKAVARNLSDVAAMGAVPRACLANLALPAGMPEARARAILDGIRLCGRQYGCPLIGGDTGLWKGPLAISVAVLAEPAAGRFIARSGARAGDRLYVSGTLGGAWTKGEAGGRHLDFEPRLELGQTLARTLGAGLHAMMDLSDGLAADLPRLLAASGIRAEIHTAQIPLTASLENQPDGWRQGLNDGEDYELLLAVAPDHELPAECCGVRLSSIGTCLPEAPDSRRCVLVKPDGSRENLPAGGWEHTA